MTKLGMIVLSITLIAFATVFSFAAPTATEANPKVAPAATPADKSLAISSAAAPNKDGQVTVHLDKARGQERVSQITGMNVTDGQNHKLGSVNDMIVNQDGRIVYVILSHGGFLGIGDKLVPIPWNTLRANGAVDADKYALVIDMTKEQIEQAPNFESKTWPNFGDSEWGTRISNYFNSFRKGKENAPAGKEGAYMGTPDPNTQHGSEARTGGSPATSGTDTTKPAGSIATSPATSPAPGDKPVNPAPAGK